MDLDFGLGLFNGPGLKWFSFWIWTWTGFSRNVDLKNRDSEFNEPAS